MLHSFHSPGVGSGIFDKGDSSHKPFGLNTLMGIIPPGLPECYSSCLRASFMARPSRSGWPHNYRINRRCRCAAHDFSNTDQLCGGPKASGAVNLLPRQDHPHLCFVVFNQLAAYIHGHVVDRASERKRRLVFMSHRSAEVHAADNYAAEQADSERVGQFRYYFLRPAWSRSRAGPCQVRLLPLAMSGFPVTSNS